MRIGRTIFSEERAFIAARYLSGEYKPRLRPRRWHNQSQSICCKGGLLECDFDDDPDELDTSTSLELRQRADPRYLAKVAKRLDVVWKVSSKKVRFSTSEATPGRGHKRSSFLCREASQDSVHAAVVVVEVAAVSAKVLNFS